MPIIPPRVSAIDRAARLQFLGQVKQVRFKYSLSSAELPIPVLDPACGAVIQAQQPENWFDASYVEKDEARRSHAFSTYFGPPVGFPQTLQDYGNLKHPYVVAVAVPHTPTLFDDRSFAAQRLTGANPLMIRRVRDIADLPPTLAITEAQIMPGVKLQTAIAEGRLYLCDFAHLGAFAGPGAWVSDPLDPIGAFTQQKFLTAPIGLFYWKGAFDDSGQLLPLGIQLRQTSAAGTFLPPGSMKFTHTNNWALAKAAFQVADVHAHEWDSHIVRTHFILGAFAISAERHLHDDHPLLVLLRPHLRYTLAINSKAEELIGLGQKGDQLLAPKREQHLKFLLQNYTNYRFSTMANPKEELKSRAMLDAPIPYPYRDDGVPVYEAITKFVNRYVNLYYSDATNEVAADDELQNFIKELRDPGRGNIKALTTSDAPIENIRQLTILLANVIWSAGPLHAMVNFAQWDYMADPRNMPFAGYQEPPDDGIDPPPGNIVGFFPRYYNGKVQAAVAYILGTYRLDMLGHYRPKDFTDPAALKEIAVFQCALAQIGAATYGRDAERHFSYPYLLPWYIPNSTNI